MNSSELLDFNVNGLRNFYKSDSTARIIFESWAGRQNKMRITTVTSLHSTLHLAGYDISRQDVIKTFRKLQELSCGKFVSAKVKGSANEQSRFIWQVSLVTVGKIATEKKLR